jgi:hypothetical protein
MDRRPYGTDSQKEHLPIQLSTKFELLVNLKTREIARATIPESFLLRPDEVIE